MLTEAQKKDEALAKVLEKLFIILDKLSPIIDKAAQTWNMELDLEQERMKQVLD